MLETALDLDAEPLDHNFRWLLLTFPLDDRFDVALEQELMLAPGALCQVPIDVGSLLVVYLPVEVEIEAG